MFDYVFLSNDSLCQCGLGGSGCACELVDKLEAQLEKKENELKEAVEKIISEMAATKNNEQLKTINLGA